MSVDSKYYLHKSDKAALKALKAIPGFSKLTKSFMNVTFERQWRITNMSSCVRINENQLSKYYDMLPPICEKLGIDVPQLYVELDPEANAGTYGDTEPFIVITSGLLETIPDELIPTVLAHECGHIACHHTLYRTMGSVILSGASSALTRLPFGDIISLPLQVAFYYWMRCSEFSADRAAAIVDGDASKMAEVCMRLAGYDKDIDFEANKEEFMNQALEYREMVKDSKWNKTIEFYINSFSSHPLTAVRALEVTEWSNSEVFKKIQDGTISDKDIDNNEEEIEENFVETKDSEETKKKRFEFPKLNRKNETKDEDEKPPTDVYSEIRECKSLLDDGIITQEEFEAKKKELLGL